MKEEFGYAVKDVSDKEHKELTPEWIYSILEEKYIHVDFLCTVYSFQKSNRLIAAHSASIEDSMISSYFLHEKKQKIFINDSQLFQCRMHLQG